jgi:hypothetical protein
VIVRVRHQVLTFFRCGPEGLCCCDSWLYSLHCLFSLKAYILWFNYFTTPLSSIKLRSTERWTSVLRVFVKTKRIQALCNVRRMAHVAGIHFLAPGLISKLLKQRWISPNTFQFKPLCIVRIILVVAMFSRETKPLSFIHTEHNFKWSAQELTSLVYLRAENRRKLTKRNRDGVFLLQCNTKLTRKIFTGIYIYIYIYIYVCVCVCVFDVWLTVHRNSVWIRKTN